MRDILVEMLNREAPIPEGEPEILARGYGRAFIRQRFKQPDGTSVDYTQFGITSENIPSIVIPITTNKNVVAEVQYRHGAKEAVIEVPGGNPIADESPEEVVLRELEKETGYQPEQIIQLTKDPIFFDPASFTVPYWAFLALGCKLTGEKKLDETEFIETIEIPIEEWFQLVLSGAVRDSKTIALTFLAIPHIGVKLQFL